MINLHMNFINILWKVGAYYNPFVLENFRQNYTPIFYKLQLIF